MIDEFLSKTNIGNAQCSNYRDTADVIAKTAFKMFLGIFYGRNGMLYLLMFEIGITCEVTNWNNENTAFSLILPPPEANPLIEFVEIPPQYVDLVYGNLLCGVIKGALEMIQIDVDAKYVKDVLKGDDMSEIRVECKGILETVMSDEYKEN